MELLVVIELDCFAEDCNMYYFVMEYVMWKKAHFSEESLVALH